MLVAAMLLPFDPSTFAALAFAGRFATHGTDILGWQECLVLHDEALTRTFAKGEGPAVQLGLSPERRRTNETVSHVTGLAIDLDEGVPDFAPIREVLTELRSQGLTYLAQWRWAETTWKVHILLPYAEKYPIYSPRDVRDYQLDLTRKLLGNRAAPDPAVAKAAGLVYCMTRRPDSDTAPQQEVFHGQFALDLVGLYPPSQQQVATRQPRLTRDQVQYAASTLLAELQEATWIESKGAWDVRCPVDHGADYKSKTFLYPSGTMSCMAGRCTGKPLAWFISHLDAEAQERILSASTAVLRADLTEAIQPRVSLAEAETKMVAALRNTRAVERHATAVQVSTGAGKTRAVAQYLNDYSAPFEGEKDGSGLSAVLAVPTNALLNEVEQRITIPHRKQVGVLAVLNDDGTPACKKHRAARTIQEAGGNVHRLMCGHCEYREDCPARDGASSGAGALTLTNHALMTTAATAFHGRGRHPLLVWDESPKWVDQAVLENREVTWLLSEFDREALPRRDAIEAIVEGSLFAARYRVAVRPILEVIRASSGLPEGQYDMATLVRKWARVPYHKSILGRALAAVGATPSGDTYNDVKGAYVGSSRLNTLEMGFDGMRGDTQQRVLRAERIMKALAIALGDGGMLIRSETHVTMASLTASATLFKEYGGVVLDATANQMELKALRPDLTSVTLRVQDGGSSERYIIHTNGLSRTATQRRPETLGAVVDHAKRSVRRWARGQGLDGADQPKVVVFTYRGLLPLLRAAWPEVEFAYFGNTRGYDRFFQEGFDCFITIGDPVSNLSALALQWTVLGGDVNDVEAFRRYTMLSAESEAAQAHGRARDPQPKLGQGGRLHLHYGVRAPSGWDLDNTQIETLTED